MLTIFAIPKPFRGKIATIQRNAIISWTKLSPRPKIILFGRDEGVAEIAKELNLLHVGEIACNHQGTPLVSDAFSIAQNLSTEGLLTYINSDIILTSDFMDALGKIHLPKFLMSGQRCNLDLNQTIDFEHPHWERNLLSLSNKSGQLEGVQGMDYFVFPRQLYQNLPPFAVGRAGWDNWMVYQALKLGVPLIDSTSSITAIHQNHDYNHHPQGKEGAYRGKEAQMNKELMGGEDYTYFRLDLANWLMTPEGLQLPQWEQQKLHRCLEMLPLVQPEFRGSATLLKHLLQEGLYSNLDEEQMGDICQNLGKAFFGTTNSWLQFSFWADSQGKALTLPVPTERRTIEKLQFRLRKKEREVRLLQAKLAQVKAVFGVAKVSLLFSLWQKIIHFKRLS